MTRVTRVTPVTPVTGPLELIEVVCPVCSSRARSPYAEENGFRLHRCRGCGLLYVSPRPHERAVSEAAMTGLHAGDETLDATGEFSASKKARYAGVLSDLYGDAPERAAGSWLDIGCGHGEWMEALIEWSNAHGQPAYPVGQEPNVHKRAAAARRGLDVSVVDLSGPPADTGDRYAHLSLLNVFSHLPSPQAALADWCTRLQPGGELLLETGDSARVPARYHHRPFHLPDHLTFASEPIVVQLLERLGFELLAVVKYPISPAQLGSPARVAKEALKLVWPGKSSALPRLLPRNMTYDMFIRARLSR